MPDLNTETLYKCERDGGGISSPWMRSLAKAIAWARAEAAHSGVKVRIYRRTIDVIKDVAPAEREAPR
jgi:hypothetical protein